MHITNLYLIEPLIKWLKYITNRVFWKACYIIMYFNINKLKHMEHYNRPKTSKLMYLHHYDYLQTQVQSASLLTGLWIWITYFLQGILLTKSIINYYKTKLIMQSSNDLSVMWKGENFIKPCFSLNSAFNNWPLFCQRKIIRALCWIIHPTNSVGSTRHCLDGAIHLNL